MKTVFLLESEAGDPWYGYNTLAVFATYEAAVAGIGPWFCVPVDGKVETFIVEDTSHTTHGSAVRVWDVSYRRGDDEDEWWYEDARIREMKVED